MPVHVSFHSFHFFVLYMDFVGLNSKEGLNRNLKNVDIQK